MTRHIASFGIGGTIPRVHVYDSFARHIFEAGEGGDGDWYNGELIGVTGAPRPSADYYDAIASFALGGQTSRIYYFDEDEISRDRQVAELGWGDDDRWYAAKVGVLAQAPPARQGSDIACFGVNGGASRVYYFADDGSVIELAWQGGGRWSWANISADIGAPAAHVDSDLACFAVGGWATRLYYFDADAQVVEIGWSAQEEDWYFAAAGRSAGAPPSGPEKVVGCFGVDGVVPRIYYFTADGQAVELGIGDDQAWYAGILPIGETLANSRSELVCFGFGGRDTRLYFLDVDGNLVEVGWDADGKWYASIIDAADPGDRSNSPTIFLTGFALGGQASAVYYTTRAGRLVELRFSGGAWIKTVRIESVTG